MTAPLNVVLDIRPPWLLTANQRLHWREKAGRTATLRFYAGSVVRHHRIPAFTSRVRVVANVAWPDRRRRDEHNLMPTLKALIDGLVDAGVFPDDSTAWLVGPDIRAAGDLCPPGLACRITLHIEEEL